MPELNFVLAGQDTGTAADELAAALAEGGDVAVHRTEAKSLPESERKAVDPIALASLIVSIPSATLAVWDIADRIRKRRKAQAVIETAKRLKAEKRIEIYILAADGAPRGAADLNADKLLDLVAEIDPSPPGKGG